MMWLDVYNHYFNIMTWLTAYNQCFHVMTWLIAYNQSFHIMTWLKACNQSKFGYLLGRWSNVCWVFDFLRFFGHAPFWKSVYLCLLIIFWSIFGNFWTSFLYLWFLYHDFGPPFYICDSHTMLLGNARIWYAIPCSSGMPGSIIRLLIQYFRPRV